MPAKLTKRQDEEHDLDRRLGAKLRYETWADVTGRVVRFNMAYINPHAYAGDNGRVLGYDNAHGQVHRHYRGVVSSLGKMSYDQAWGAFDREFRKLWSEES
jgi:hypothetical protein